MTRRLVLIRHAKAGDAWPDHERPLAERGRLDAPAIGRWLVGQGLVPDRVVVSSAVRTRETWAGAASELAAPPVAEFDERIYANSVDDLLAVLRESSDEVGTVVLVGHNPSVQALALYLDGGAGEDEVIRRVSGRFPTSAIALVHISPVWSQLGADTGALTGYADPGDF